MNISINITDRDLIKLDSGAINDLIQALKAISAHATQESEETPQNGTAKETTPKEKPKTKATPKKTVEPIETASETVEPITEDKAADYTTLRDELRKELAAIARAGKSAGLKKLLEEYGVEKFSELPDEKLEDFRAAAKAL